MAAGAGRGGRAGPHPGAAAHEGRRGRSALPGAQRLGSALPGAVPLPASLVCPPQCRLCPAGRRAASCLSVLSPSVSAALGPG